MPKCCFRENMIVMALPKRLRKYQKSLEPILQGAPTSSSNFMMGSSQSVGFYNAELRSWQRINRLNNWVAKKKKSFFVFKYSEFWCALCLTIIIEKISSKLKTKSSETMKLLPSDNCSSDRHYSSKTSLRSAALHMQIKLFCIVSGYKIAHLENNANFVIHLSSKAAFLHCFVMPA